MRVGLIAKKLGMTRFFREDGSNIPVTLLGLEKNYVTRIKETISKNLKYIQIASGNIKIKKIKEFKIPNDQNINVGDTLDVSFFKVGQYVDVSGKSNGKGFAGPIKRHNFSGLGASHGVSVSHRSHGSTGQCQDPGRTFKGKKMAGQMGNKKVTIHNLEVVKIDNEDETILIKGPVPGSKGTLLIVRDAIKPKSLVAKIKKEEIKEDLSKKEKKAELNEVESKETSQEKPNEQKAKEDKK